MKSRSLLSVLALMLIAPLALSALGAGSGSGPLKVLKFEADWCGPCQQMKPIFNSVSSEFKAVTFQTIDVDRQTELANTYKVESLPTVIAVKDGKVVGRLVGFQNAARLKAFIKKHQ